MFDPDYVYTFHTWQHYVDFGNYKFSLVRLVLTVLSMIALLSMHTSNASQRQTELLCRQQKKNSARHPTLTLNP